MDKKTYTNQKLIDCLAENFYIAKVNAKTKNSATWADKTYTCNSNYSMNNFALYATNGHAGFPATIILTNENDEPVFNGRVVKY